MTLKTGQTPCGHYVFSAFPSSAKADAKVSIGHIDIDHGLVVIRAGDSVLLE
jgi:hypothetical protein